MFLVYSYKECKRMSFFCFVDVRIVLNNMHGVMFPFLLPLGMFV